MTGKNWTKEELKLLNKMAGKVSVFDIAQILGRSYDSVETKARRIGVSTAPVSDKTKEKLTKKELSADRRVRTKTEIEDARKYVIDTQEAFMDYKLPEVKLPKRGKNFKQEEDALLLWSDMHTGMVNKAPGSNIVTYNDEIRRMELENLYAGIVRLKELYEPNIRLRNLYIASLGDNSTNDRIFEGQEFEISMPMGAQLLAYKTDKSWFINQMLEHFENVVDVEIVGNHGRSRPNKTAEPVEDNFEWLIGHQLKEKFSGNTRVHIVVPDDFTHTLEIRKHKFLLQHGDNFRGMSRNSIERACKDLVALGGKNDQHDVICIGHYHSVDKQQVSPNTTLLVNGCWIYNDSYAYNRLRKFSTAKQLFVRVSNKMPIAGINEIDLTWGIDFKKVNSKKAR